MRHITSPYHKTRNQQLFVLTTFAAVAMAMLLLFGSHLQDNLHAQPYRQPEELKRPTSFGQRLLFEIPDFRLDFLSPDAIEVLRKRGLVCLTRSGQFKGESYSEHSLEQWRTVADAIREISSLNRKGRRPQIRVIQKNAILQSAINDANTLSGYSTDFLDRKLNAADIIIIAPLYD